MFPCRGGSHNNRDNPCPQDSLQSRRMGAHPRVWTPDGIFDSPTTPTNRWRNRTRILQERKMMSAALATKGREKEVVSIPRERTSTHLVLRLEVGVQRLAEGYDRVTEQMLGPLLPPSLEQVQSKVATFPSLGIDVGQSIIKLPDSQEFRCMINNFLGLSLAAKNNPGESYPKPS